jgi:hypothetical protein
MDKNLRSKDHTIFKLSKNISFKTHLDWIPFNIGNCGMYHFNRLRQAGHMNMYSNAIFARVIICKR